MKTKEVLKKLNISKSTLFKYISDFELDIKKTDSGYSDFSDEDINYIKNIMSLREADNGINTIQRMLKVKEDKPSIDSSDTINERSLNYSQNNTEQVVTMLSKIDGLEITLTELTSNFKLITDLADKYSKATFEIGKLQAELQAEKDKNKLISEHSNKDLDELKKQNERLVVSKDFEINNLKEEVEILKSNLNNEKTKTFWQRLFNRT